MRAALIAALLAACAEPAPKPAAEPALNVPPIIVTPAPVEAGAPALVAAPPADEKAMSYEGAIAFLDAVGASAVPLKTPKMTDRALAEPLRDDRFIAACGKPKDAVVTIKIVVHNGTVYGLTVEMAPDIPGVRACIEDGVRTLRWPVTGHYDRFSARY